MIGIRPFWHYYGGKWRAAPRYPKPIHGTIIEPFAGAAGYSMRYPDRNVILVEKYPVIAELWRWLIAAKPADVLAVPCVEHIDDLPSWVPAGARALVGLCLNYASTRPARTMSNAIRGKIAAASNGGCYAWSNHRERIASQVDAIKHWRIIEGDWYRAPTIEATWFVDPPYNNKAGSHYVHGPDRIDFDLLARGCRAMPGQVIVCENDGADWLPFEPFGTFKAGPRSPGGGSKEVIWTATNPLPVFEYEAAE